MQLYTHFVWSTQQLVALQLLTAPTLTSKTKGGC